MAQCCPWRIFKKIFLAYVTSRLPMSVHKKIQPIRSSRLKGTYIQMLFKQSIEESEDAIPCYHHSLTRVYLIHHGTQFKP